MIRSKTETLKPSIFNIMLANEDRVLWFNSVSTMLLSLEWKQHEIISAALDRLVTHDEFVDPQLIDLLSANGFIVRSAEDEYEREHQQFLATRNSKEHLYFVIAPTMRCNAACPYCFQRDVRTAPKMSFDTQRRVIDFFREKVVGVKKVGVQWFGGEPLVALPIIETLSRAFQEICEHANVVYNADMLTNGLELSPEIIGRLSKLAIRAMQIPLDGLPGTYALRKGITLNRSTRFFDMLRDNIRELLAAAGSLVIRINVDRQNIDQAREVVLWMKRSGMTDPRIDFRLALLEDVKALGTCPTTEACYTNAEFGSVDIEFRRFLVAEGLTLYGFPERRAYSCIAHLANAYTIDPQGRVGKCVPEIGRREHTYQTLMRAAGAAGDCDSSIRIPYSEFDPYVSRHCENCPFLPVCQGQCPRQHEVQPDFPCSIKRGIIERLALYDEYHRQLANSITI